MLKVFQLRDQQMENKTESNPPQVQVGRGILVSYSIFLEFSHCSENHRLRSNSLVTQVPESFPCYFPLSLPPNMCSLLATLTVPPTQQFICLHAFPPHYLPLVGKQWLGLPQTLQISSFKLTSFICFLANILFTHFLFFKFHIYDVLMLLFAHLFDFAYSYLQFF